MALSLVRQVRIFFLLVMILMVFCHLSAQASRLPLRLDKEPLYDLTGRMEQLVDPAGKLTLTDVLAPTVAARFKPLDGSLNKGYGSEAVWLRFAIMRSKGFPENAFLRLVPPNVDHVAVYIQSGLSSLQSNSYHEIRLGDHIPVVHRPVLNPDLVAPLLLPLERPILVYIRIQTNNEIKFSGEIRTHDDLLRYTYEGIIFQSAYLGVALIIAMVNLIFFLRLGDRSYLYFALFVFTLFIIYLSEGGLLTLLDPFSAHRFSDYFLDMSLGAVLLFSSLFSIEIFTLKKSRLRRYLLFLPLLGLLSILSVPFGLYDLMAPFTVAGFLVLIMIMSWLSVRSIIKGEPYGVLYMVTFGISNLGYFIDFLRQLGWIQLDWGSTGSIQLFSLLNMILMFLVLTERLRSAEKQATTAARYSEKRALVLADGMTMELRERNSQLDVLLKSELLAGDALRQSEERFRHFFEDHSAVMLVLDPFTGTVIDANQAAADFYGWSIDELRRMSIQQINTLPPEMVMAEMEKSRLMIQNEFSFQHRMADGSLRDVEVFSNKIDVAHKELVYSIIHDVTERKHYERVNACRLHLLQMSGSASVDDLLRAALDEVGRLTESSIGFVFFVAEDQATLSLRVCLAPGIVKSCSAEKQGKNHLLDKTGAWFDIIKGQRAVIHNDKTTFRHCAGMPEGQAEVKRELIVPIIRNDSVVAIIGIGNKPHDYSDKDIEWVEALANQLWDIVAKKIVEEKTKKLQDQLQQSAKMEMIGQLAAGIIHEIKNPLNFLMVNQYTLKEDFGDLCEFVGSYRRILEKVGAFPAVAEELELLCEKERSLDLDDLLRNIPETLENSRNGVERIKIISEGLLNYSFKNVTGRLCSFDLNKAIQDVLVIAKSEYHSVATLALQLENLQMVLCDPSQINQVLLNLIINSAYAIKSQSRSSLGQIMIKTWATAEYVSCSVADDGPGIPEEIMDRVFEPFFSTKELGKGTGLGLSISYDIIVNKHHGTFSVDSSPESGAMFTFSLPVRSSEEVLLPPASDTVHTAQLTVLTS